MENKFKKDFEVTDIDITIDYDSLELDEWEDVDVVEDGHTFGESGAKAKADGKIKATVHYIPEDIKWDTIWNVTLKGDTKGYESYPASWDDPGSSDWDSIVWDEYDYLDFESEDTDYENYPDVLRGNIDGNKDFDEAWEAVTDAVYKAVDEHLPFEE